MYTTRPRDSRQRKVQSQKVLQKTTYLFTPLFRATGSIYPLQRSHTNPFIYVKKKNPFIQLFQFSYWNSLIIIRIVNCVMVYLFVLFFCVFLFFALVLAVFFFLYTWFVYIFISAFNSFSRSVSPAHTYRPCCYGCCHTASHRRLFHCCVAVRTVRC